jgi:hypothetical protein
MIFYNGKLTLVVFIFSLTIAVVISIMVPTFRKHLENLYQAEGSRPMPFSRNNSWHVDRKVVGVRTRWNANMK